MFLWAEISPQIENIIGAEQKLNGDVIFQILIALVVIKIVAISQLRYMALIIVRKYGHSAAFVTAH